NKAYRAFFSFDICQEISFYLSTLAPSVAFIAPTSPRHLLLAVSGMKKGPISVQSHFAYVPSNTSLNDGHQSYSTEYGLHIIQQFLGFYLNNTERTETHLLARQADRGPGKL